MKPITGYLALIFLTSAGSVIAQTTSAPGVATSRPALSAAEIAKIAEKINASGIRRGSGAFNITPEEKARVDAGTARFNELNHAGTEALHLKNFAAAEADYREMIQIQSLVNDYYGLGEALAGQGRMAEAIAAYKTAVYWPLNTNSEAIAISQARGNKSNLRGCCNGTDAVAWLKYALLLSQAGQNAEAFSVYSQAMCQVNDPDRSGITLFSAGGPQSPSEFQSAAHIALGLLTGGMLTDREQAMTEFDQALRLAPDAAVTNYYYGYGWQRLDPKSQTRTANALQAKAALTKAAASEDDNIKKAAEDAMKRMP